jgi:hypothetical protein
LNTAKSVQDYHHQQKGGKKQEAQKMERAQSTSIDLRHSSSASSSIVIIQNIQDIDSGQAKKKPLLLQDCMNSLSVSMLGLGEVHQNWQILLQVFTLFRASE